VAHDASWWAANVAGAAFAGLKVTGQPGPKDAIVFPVRADSAEISPNRTLQVVSSGLMAIRWAAAQGVASIRLIGFDGGLEHWHEAPQRCADTAAAVEIALQALIGELAARGIEAQR
jgi:hypothetical protein